jgi:NADPH2:quinone reductase
MKAALIESFGPPDNFKIVDIPVPEIGEDEVLVKMVAAGLMYADVQVRAGEYLYPNEVTFPAVLGFEGVGVIEAVGSAVQGLEPGARVSAEFDNGAYAEYAKTTAAKVIPLPDGPSFEQALVYSFNLPAAYLLYYTYFDIPKDATVLIHSAAGGLGGMLTRIAKKEGNTVIGLVSRSDKVEAAKAVGADHVIVTSTSQYVEEVNRITNGRGVDAIFNHVAGETLVKDLNALAFRGRWICTNLLDGVDAVRDIDPLVLLAKCVRIAFGSSGQEVNTPAWNDALAYLGQWLQEQPLDEPARTFPLDELAEAHRWVESRQSVGKIAISI